MTSIPDDFAEERAAAIARESGTWRESLRARYPVCTSGLVRGLDIGDGWHKIAEDFCDELNALLGGEDLCPKFKLTQIKQKFGLLRVYFDGADDEIAASVERAIRSAVNRSSKTCEICGGVGRLVEDRRQFRVACIAHDQM